MKNNTIKDIILFVIFGLLYCGLEILWRGYTHPSMFVVGGICCLLVGLINEITPEMPMWLQCLLSAIIITIMEFLSGCILNLWLDLGVWNYTNIQGTAPSLWTQFSNANGGGCFNGCTKLSNYADIPSQWK